MIYSLAQWHTQSRDKWSINFPEKEKKTNKQGLLHIDKSKQRKCFWVAGRTQGDNNWHEVMSTDGQWNIALWRYLNHSWQQMLKWFNGFDHHLGNHCPSPWKGEDEFGVGLESLELRNETTNDQKALTTHIPQGCFLGWDPAWSSGKTKAV